MRHATARAWMWVAALGLCGCNPAHVQNEGPYQLTAIEVLKDECGLLTSPEALWDTELLISGEVIRINFDLLNMQMVGFFLGGDERFAVDGSVANAAAIVNGQECLLDQVAARLEGTTVCRTEFSGTLRVRYEARRPDSCVCELWTTYRAVQDSATCPAVP